MWNEPHAYPRSAATSRSVDGTVPLPTFQHGTADCRTSVPLRAPVDQEIRLHAEQGASADDPKVPVRLADLLGWSAEGERLRRLGGQDTPEDNVNTRRMYLEHKTLLIHFCSPSTLPNLLRIS